MLFNRFPLTAEAVLRAWVNSNCRGGGVDKTYWITRDCRAYSHDESESSRLALPKQLQAWGRGNCLEACIRTAEIAGLNPIVVVLGDRFEGNSGAYAFRRDFDRTQPGVGKGAKHLFESGISGLAEVCFGAVFMLADQCKFRCHSSALLWSWPGKRTR